MSNPAVHFPKNKSCSPQHDIMSHLFSGFFIVDCDCLVDGKFTSTRILYKYPLDCLEIHKEFANIPELAELTNTPFMVEIVTEILQRLKQQGRPLSEIKSQLAITLDEETAEKAWAVLRNEHVLENLTTIQDALDVGGDRSLRDEWTGKELLISWRAKIAVPPK